MNPKEVQWLKSRRWRRQRGDEPGTLRHPNLYDAWPITDALRLQREADRGLISARRILNYPKP